MARQPTTSDVFNAIAEPRRRQILELLARRGGLAVSVMVAALDLPQPVVSKHLGVLRQVGIVQVEKQGKQRLYHLDAKQLKPIHDWTSSFERLWDHQLDRVKRRAEQLARQRKQSPSR